MNIVYLVLIVLALVCFALAAVSGMFPQLRRDSLIGFGLFCWLLATLVRQ